ncbi:MAG TPA: type II secretion system protein GspG [Verrucomicrobia bacterium]|nr:MAG: type II secretion system protein GspG [Lentisphaerae bacterium GWF2_57_35]HBA85849.1 type II secretion system protein GspG [Verrucomicrobiota bacterium]
MKRRTYTEYRRPTAEGFTLIEILVVVMIIAILAGIVSINVLSKPAEARVSAARMQIKQLQTALQMYRTEQGRLPTQLQGLEALVKLPSTDPMPARYPEEGYLESRTLPKDPWGSEYIYLIPGRNGEVFEIVSYGSDSEPGGEGDAADLSSAHE